MKTKPFVIYGLTMALLACNPSKKEQLNNSFSQITLPSDQQVQWANAEIGVLIHFDMPTFVPDYNWRNFGSHPSASTFNPTKLDTDQWLESAQKIGAKYAVLVAKHCSGFSLWPTQAHEYSIKNSPWKNGKGDIVADFIASCKKYGIKPGIYASTTANGYLQVDNPGYVISKDPEEQQKYNAIVTQQLTELWSNYGELFEIWFDGGVLSKSQGGADILNLVQKLQPKAIAFQGPYGHPNLVRWVGNEEGVAPYPCWATTDSTTNADGTVVIDGLHGSNDGKFWCPGEADFPLRRNNSFQGGWFWKEGEDEMLFSVDELMDKYSKSVGRNTNLLLGIVIDRDGLVPQADVKRLEEFGYALNEKYGKPTTQLTNQKGTHFVIKPGQHQKVSTILLSEAIEHGERIQSFTVYGTKNNKKEILSKGESVGNKYIQHFTPDNYTEITIDILESKDTPLLNRIALFE